MPKGIYERKLGRKRKIAMTQEEKNLRSESGKRYWKNHKSTFGNVAKKKAQKLWEEREKIHPIFKDHSLYRRYDYWMKNATNPEILLSIMTASICYACGKEESAMSNGGTGKRKRGLSIDHDHKTMTLRGALCLKCNIALGHVGDDPNLLEMLAAYLRKSKNGA